MLKTDVVLDHNWVTVMTLAGVLGVHHSTVNNWIVKDRIDYIILPNTQIRRYLVDQRTAPAVQKKGRPRKPTLSQQPRHC
jgi:hypothetical protein